MAKTKSNSSEIDKVTSLKKRLSCVSVEDQERVLRYAILGLIYIMCIFIKHL